MSKPYGLLMSTPAAPWKPRRLTKDLIPSYSRFIWEDGGPERVFTGLALGGFFAWQADEAFQLLGKAVVFLVFFAVGFLVRTRPPVSASADSLALREANPGQTWYPVAIQVHQGDLGLGGDSGVAWFEDGQLCFRGSRTEFRSNKADFEEDSLTSQSRISMLSRSLRYVHEDRIFELTIRPYERWSPREPLEEAEDFDRRFREWLRTPSAGRPSTLPPLQMRSPTEIRIGQWTMLAAILAAAANALFFLPQYPLFGALLATPVLALSIPL